MNDSLSVTDPSVAIRASMLAEEYHAARAMSSTGIKHLMRSPAHYRAWLETPMKATAAMQFGTLVHTAILEPDKLESRTRMIPDDAPTRQSKAGKQWWEDFSAGSIGRIMVDRADWEKLEGLRQSALDSPSVQVLLAECVPEVSLAWRDQGVTCKARLDATPEGFARIVDLKSTTDATPEAFSRAIHRYGYHIQAAWYLRGAIAHSSTMPEWYWLAIETTKPFAISPYRAPAKMLTHANGLIERALSMYRKCVAENYWPAYDPAIRDIDLPAWSYREQWNAEEF